MIPADVRAQIRRLVLGDGLKVETVARRFGVHHSVVERALRDDPNPARQAKPPSALEPFKPYIVERITELPELSSVRLLEELRARGLTTGIAQLRRYVAQIRRPRGRKPYLRIEVDPADQAQVDWGSFGQMRVGAARRPLSVFAMVMSWSRALFLDFALDQRMDTFLRMHRRALEFFGGVPRKIVYDNLKSVVLHHVGSTLQFNPRFLVFAGHYLFEATAAPVRYPEFKGRVEASIKYIRQSFFYGRAFSSLEDLRQKAAAWRDQTANQRIHAATRQRPAERLVLEKSRLRALPEHPFNTDLVIDAIVTKEARVRLDANTYSVPPRFVGHTVQIRASDDRVRVLCQGQLIAEHARSWDRGAAIEDPRHLEKLLEQRKTARGPKQRDRLLELCPPARAYLHQASRRRIDLTAEVRKLAHLCELYGPDEVGAAVALALARGTLGARYVRALCDQARFDRGHPEPADLIVTGNATADALAVEPHNMETYDALFERITEKASCARAHPGPDGDAGNSAGRSSPGDTDPES